MKYVLTALLTLSFSLRAEVADPNAELRASLESLHERIRVQDPVRFASVMGFVMASASLAGVGAVATLLRLRALPLAKWSVHPGWLMNQTVDVARWGVVFGAGATLAAQVAGVARWVHQRGTLIDYHTVKGLSRFFALPVDEQVDLAAKDPAFARYLVRLDHDLDHVYLGFDDPRVRP